MNNFAGEKTTVEVYKGIKFVRISTLPENQKLMILSAISSQKIIKILRGEELLNDCIQYDDYLSLCICANNDTPLSNAQKN